MTEPEGVVERVARAIQAEMRRQGALYEVEPGVEDLSRLMMNTGEAADLLAVVRAALEAASSPASPDTER